MKTYLSALALLALFAVGCGPDKTKACAGCEGPELSDCEQDYEECDNITHCKPSDIRTRYAENLCLGDDSDY